MKAIAAKVDGAISLRGHTRLQNGIFLALVDFPGQAAVSDGIDDDWLVGLGAGLLEEFRTCGKQNIKKINRLNPRTSITKEEIQGFGG